MYYSALIITIITTSISRMVFYSYYFHLDINECAQSQCSHSCLNTIGSFVCTCPSGFTLSSSNQLQCIGKNSLSYKSKQYPILLSLPDINECANNPGCSHSCANTPGSFRCTCPSGGYQLGSDRRTCEGTNNSD